MPRHVYRCTKIIGLILRFSQDITAGCVPRPAAGGGYAGFADGGASWAAHLESAPARGNNTINGGHPLHSDLRVSMSFPRHDRGPCATECAIVPDQSAKVVVPGIGPDRFTEIGEVETAKVVGRQGGHEFAGPPGRFEPLLLHGRQVHGLLQQQVIEFVLGICCVA